MIYAFTLKTLNFGNPASLELQYSFSSYPPHAHTPAVTGHLHPAVTGLFPFPLSLFLPRTVCPPFPSELLLQSAATWVQRPRIRAPLPDGRLLLRLVGLYEGAVHLDELSILLRRSFVGIEHEMDIDGKGDSVEEFKSLHITTLDDDDDNDEEIAVGEDDNEEDEDDGDEEEEDEPVILGFVEKPEHSWSLLRQQFPSKAGGIPAWLDPDNLPSGTSCVCDICGEPLQFVLQVYAPLVEKDSTFHRTLFVFMCLSMNCLLRDQHEQWKHRPDKQSRSVKVFRCQLPCANPFYSSEPPKGNATDKPLTPGAPLCNWCGTWKGDKFCSSCKVARYCSQKHQAMHWRSGHRHQCQQLSLSPQSSESDAFNGAITQIKPQTVANKSLWPEYEVKNEHESEYDTEMSGDDGHSHNSLVPRKRIDDTLKSLLNNFEGDDDKKCWASFQERIAKAPEQVLRYCRSATAKPLWPMLGGRPSKADIPRCSYCGGNLCFEFQILPQLLYYFGVKNDADSLDWATIMVYTCEASCEGVGYKEEFAWVQLSASTNFP